MIRRALILIFIGSLAVTACNNTPETSASPTAIETDTPNIAVVTADVTRRAAELPPTWTPTATSTITPTPTITPTFTITPSPTPYDIDAMCADFVFTTDIVDGRTYSEDDSFTLSYGIGETYDYVFIGFALSNVDIEKDIATAAPGGTSYNALLDPRQFPTSGRWDYRAGVFITGEENVLCEHTGYFIIQEGITHAEQPKIPTALPVPSVTPSGFAEVTEEAESTAEVTAEMTADVEITDEPGS